MTKSFCQVFSLAVAGICIFVFLAAPANAQIYLDINEPQLRRIPLAIPDFVVEATQPSAPAAARQGEKLLREFLDFTGFFNILPPQGYLTDLGRGVTETQIRFSDWTAIGAELLISAKLVDRGGRMSFELRLFDTFANTVIAGRAYTAHPDQVRDVIRRFSAEVIYRLTGTRGIFESQIAFVSTGTGNKEIFFCEFDGYAPSQFTRDSVIALSPAWSSDGRYLAYTAYKDVGPQLYVRDLSTRTAWNIAHGSLNITPAWRPGAFEMAATLSLDNNQDIYTLTGNGKIIKRMTKAWDIDVSPTWSPDGKRMAFVSERSGGTHIFVMDEDGGQVTRLTFSGRENTEPAWSPNGRYIAYTSRVAGRNEIFVMNADGSRPRQLTSGGGDNESASWSPDSTLIAFSSTREGVSRIFVMNANGMAQRRLLILPGQQSQPAWSPLMAQ
jgi:TolB protein